MDETDWSDESTHSGEQLLDAYRECLRQTFRAVSGSRAEWLRQAVKDARDLEGWLIARLNRKPPPFRIGDKVVPTELPLFSDGGSNSTAMHKSGIFTVSGVFYAGRGGDIWYVSLEELALADVNPHRRPVRFMAQYFRPAGVFQPSSTSS